MDFTVNASARVSSLGAQNQIDMILAQIKGLRKQLLALQKKLRESTDPQEQKALMKEIMDMQQLIQLQEARIAALQQEDQRKQKLREQVNGTKAA